MEDIPNWHIVEVEAIREPYDPVNDSINWEELNLDEVTPYTIIIELENDGSFDMDHGHSPKHVTALPVPATSLNELVESRKSMVVSVSAAASTGSENHVARDAVVNVESFEEPHIDNENQSNDDVEDALSVEMDNENVVKKPKVGSNNQQQPTKAMKKASVGIVPLPGVSGSQPKKPKKGTPGRKVLPRKEKNVQNGKKGGAGTLDLRFVDIASKFEKEYTVTQDELIYETCANDFAGLISKERTEVRFVLDDQKGRLYPLSTPRMHELKHSDVIEVHFEQLAGGQDGSIGGAAYFP